MADDRQLRMKFAGGLVKHLGLQMYSGAVPSIAELISNAWDADAKNVWVDLPLDTPISEGLEVTVRDDGHGMSFDEVNDRYLVLGLNRRQAHGLYSRNGRRVLGRKGIGKLAGFGIAHVMEVWTVRDGHLTAFEMNYEVITRDEKAAPVEEYEPKILADRPVQPDDPIKAGTLVRLKRLQLKNAVSGNRFQRSMTRRFSLLSAGFRVFINGQPLVREGVDFQFRFPETGVATEEVPGIGQVQWWVGFTEKPITIEEARGVAVLAHGKLVQAPFFFELSGGMQGQHGLQYLTGEVHADLLDEDADLISTDRASVLWEDPRASPLLKWGQDKLRALLREWTRKRTDVNKTRLRDKTPLMAMVDRFPPTEQKELVAAINSLASIETITDDRLQELVRILIRAYENDRFMNLIRAMDATEPEALEELGRLIEEWDILEAVNTAQMVRGRVQVIRTFQGMIDSKAPEKPDMQDYVKEHPWLLDPAWDVLRHETSLDRVLAEHFDVKATGEEGKRRLDFFSLADSSLAVVVEVKRPGALIGRDELRQLEDYVDYLKDWNKQSTGSKRSRERIRGCLIYSRIRPDAVGMLERLAAAGIEVVTWDGLLETAERLHREFLDVVKSRAPQDDPRIEAIDELPLDESGDNSPT